MRLRTGLAIILSLGIIAVNVAPADAGVVVAVIAKHKANPEGLHAKIKQKKALSDHQPILHGHLKHK